MISITQELQTELLTKRGIDQISKRSNRLQMTRHKTDRLPLHFEHVPEIKTGWNYKPRTRNYQIAKAKRYGHTKLLVASGDLRDAVLGSARISATSKGAKLKARGSRSSNLRQQYRDEIEALTRQEDEQHSEEWVENFAAFADDTRYQKKIKRS